MTSASHYIMSASCYHSRYQSRSLMYISSLIPRNFAELAKAVPIAAYAGSSEALLLADDIITKILFILF